MMYLLDSYYLVKVALGPPTAGSRQKQLFSLGRTVRVHKGPGAALRGNTRTEPVDGAL